MSDYIKREDVLGEFAYDDLDEYYTPQIAAIVENIPSADVAPVRHGRWIITETPTNEYCNCSVCGTQVMSDEAWNYCPKCGAKMDEEEG